MTGEHIITADPSEVLAKVRDAFTASPQPGMSVIADCGPFCLANNGIGVYLNLVGSESVWEVYGAFVRRPMLDDLLCFVTDDAGICFPFDSPAPDFEVGMEDCHSTYDTTDGICDGICEGFPEPDGGIWVLAVYADGTSEWMAQINHRYAISIEDAAYLYCEESDDPYEIVSVEAHNCHSCMPGLHVQTEGGVVFYFRTEGLESDDIGAEEYRCIDITDGDGGA